MVFGTPEYMAPEQAMGQTVDGRADLYSLGIIGFEMLTGGRPFEHDNAATLLAMQITAPLPTLASRLPDANIPPEVEALVARLLEKDAARRFADAKELATAVTTLMLDLAAQGRVDTAYVDRAGTSGAISLRSLQPARASSSSATRLPGASAGPASPGLGGRSGEVAEVEVAPEAPGSAPRGANALLSVGADTASRALSIAQTYAGRLGRRGMLWVAGACALALAILLRVVIGPLAPAPATGGQAHVGGTDIVVKPAAVAAVSDAVDEHLAGAEALLQKGDYATAIAQLLPIEQDHAALARVHRDLEQAYFGTGDARSALHEAGLWLQADPHASGDPALQQELRGLALGQATPAAQGAQTAQAPERGAGQRARPEDEEAALLLLETSMGTIGPDILYDLAYGGHYGPAQLQRIHASLAKPEVRMQASAALLVTLDLRAAGGCEAKRSLLDRARDAGDARTLAVLRSYQASSGCGFLGMRDCWSCLHRDGALARALEEIEARVGKP
jgi:serine/threonine-protein kinase